MAYSRYHVKIIDVKITILCILNPHPQRSVAVVRKG